jgi:hypothetical protein
MTQAFLECTCPPGHTENVGAHHPECSHRDIDAAVTCPPGSDCCQQDHDHAAAANACHGGHEDPCPEPPGKCRAWNTATADARHPLYEGGHPLLGADHQPGDDIPDCPGGHCHKDVRGCGVCRPLVITILPGTTITPAGV